MTIHRRIFLRARLTAGPVRFEAAQLPISRARARRAASSAAAREQQHATPRELVETAVALVNDASREVALSVEVQHELDAALGRIVRIFAKPNRPFRERHSVAAGEPVAHAGGAAHSDPLQEARERGRLAAAREWEQPENLSLKDAALYAGRSDRAINQDRQAGRLYALVLPGGASEGFAIRRGSSTSIPSGWSLCLHHSWLRERAVGLSIIFCIARKKAWRDARRRIASPTQRPR